MLQKCFKNVKKKLSQILFLFLKEKFFRIKKNVYLITEKTRPKIFKLYN